MNSLFYHENPYFLRIQCFSILGENAACHWSFENSAGKHGAAQLSSEITSDQHPYISPEAYLEPNQPSMIEHFFENS